MFLGAYGFGQGGNASLGGTVEDATGALIPGVSITAINTATGITSTQVTNETGSYNFPSLQPGVYQVTAELPGFQTRRYNDVELGVGAQRRLNVSLEVGGVTETVEVSVDATQIITSSATVGNTLPEYTIRELPVVGNDVLELVRIVPGTTEGGAGTFAGINGMAVNTTRDGISVSDGRFNSGVFGTTVLNPDMVSQVNVLLTPVDAEYGRGNSQVQVGTRSGGNRFSGSAVWNIRNSGLDANTWGRNNDVDVATGQWSPTRSDWENNHQYTLSLGGPIIRNKTFFFALWDQQLNYRRELVEGSVLTSAARQGIFRYFERWNNGNADSNTSRSGANPTTAVVDVGGNPLTPLTNPNNSPYDGQLRCLSVFGNVKLDGSPFTAADCPGGTAIINPGPWDALRTGPDPTGFIQRILERMPAANDFTGGDGLNTAIHRWTLNRHGAQGAAVTIGTNQDTNRRQLNLKIDHNFNQGNKISASWTRERNDTASDVPDWPNGIHYLTVRHPQVFTTNFTSTFSPNVLNEARFGLRYSRAGIDAPWEDSYGNPEVQQEALSWTLPGANGSFALVDPGDGDYQFGGSADGVLDATPGQYNGNKSFLYTFADTVSWTRGVHALKFGAEMRYGGTDGYNNIPQLPYARVIGGALTGNQSPLGDDIAAIPRIVPTMQGDSADMLYFFSGSVGNISQLYWINSADDVTNGTWEDVHTVIRKLRDQRYREFSMFVKDDWKATQNLTLNLGLRWEYYGSPWLASGFTSTAIGQGDGMWGAFRGHAGASPFDAWLYPGQIFLSGYGPNVPADQALACAAPACNPDLLTAIEFIGPNTPNPDGRALPADWNNFGPAIGFAWQPDWAGSGTTIRGGYQVTFGGSFGGASTTAGGGGNTLDQVLGSAPGAISQANLTNFDEEFGNTLLDLSNASDYIPVRPTSPALPGAGMPISGTRNVSFYAYAPDYVTPYVQNFTLSVAHDLTRNLNLDLRYVGTMGMKQRGNLNLNLANVYHNPELLEALRVTRAGGDHPLLDQMLAGLNLNRFSSSMGPVGTVRNGVLQTGSEHLRQSTQFRSDLANGDFVDVAEALNGNGSNLPAEGTTGGLTNLPDGLSGVGGRLLRNGCDRLAAGETTVGPANPAPLRCFPENYIVANPQLGNATYNANLSNSNYHSLQAQITMRPVRGSSFQTTYTWSKALAIPTANYTDPLDRQADYTVTGSHRAHDLRVNGTLELPFGPNQWLLNSSPGWVSRLVEGWRAGVIFRASSGGPVDIGASNGLYGNPVPDVVGPLPAELKEGTVRWNGPHNQSGAVQFGTYFGDPGPLEKVSDPQCAAIATSLRSFCTLSALASTSTGDIIIQNPQPGTRGNLGQNFLVSAPTWDFDASMSKSFSVTETTTLQVRIDAQNVLNHPQPNNPQLNLNTGDEFGLITGKNNDRRRFQGQLRLSF